MAAPKIIWENQKDSNLHDKKVVESLRERLNDKIMRDPAMAKKAALILESWINKKKKL